MTHPDPTRFLLIKHSEGWNVDRCTRWMQQHNKQFEWFYPTRCMPFPDVHAHDAVIVFGGAPSANDCQSLSWVRSELAFIEAWMQADKPIFGICLGAQMLARVLGADVSAHPEGAAEVGFTEVLPTAGGADFMPQPLSLMQWHSEGFSLPHGAEHLASNSTFPNQAFQLGKQVVGVQFHPEVNPDALRIWLARNKRTKPGVLDDLTRQRFLADAQQHDAAISLWLDQFLTGWASLAAKHPIVRSCAS